MIAAVVERSVEIALLGVIAFPLARLAIDPGVRRRFRAFPRVQAAMAGALLLYASIVAVIALAEPALLRPAAGAALVVLFMERWQARAGHGRSRGLRIEIAGSGNVVTFAFAGPGPAQSLQLQGVTFTRVP